MNKTTLTLVGVGLSLGLSACDELKFNTILNVSSPFSIKSAESPKNCDDQFDWWNCSEEPEVLNLDSNQYNVVARLTNTSKTTKLILEVPQKKDKKVITIESSKKLSEADQNFSLTAQEINQDFALNGSLSTDVQDGDLQNGMESCTYVVREYVCREVEVKEVQNEKDKISDSEKRDGRNLREELRKDRENGRNEKDREHRPPLPPRKKIVCGYENVTRWGQQYVEFFMRYTTKTLALSFVKDENIVAHSYGTWRGSDKIYTHKDICR